MAARLGGSWAGLRPDPRSPGAGARRRARFRKAPARGGPRKPARESDSLPSAPGGASNLRAASPPFFTTPPRPPPPAPPPLSTPPPFPYTKCQAAGAGEPSRPSPASPPRAPPLGLGGHAAPFPPRPPPPPARRARAARTACPGLRWTEHLSRSDFARLGGESLRHRRARSREACGISHGPCCV